MSNKLYIGFTKTVELPTSGGYLFIGDEVPEIPRARVFDPIEHCFNPLKGIDYKKARRLAEVLYTLSPQGENTLTVRNGKRALLPALLKAERLDKVEGDEEVSGMIGDLLVSPLLSKVLCSSDNQFSFKPGSVILARINRAELGEFDALVLGLLLIGHFNGQVVVPDLGFYGRNIHTGLIREERLIGGVYHLGELPERLRQSCVLVKDKVLSGATHDDAELVAKMSGLVRGTVAFNEFVSAAMA